MIRLLGVFFVSIFSMLAFTVPAQAAPVCGNGVVEAGEDCDDGNSYTQNDQCDGSGVCMGTPGAVPAMSPWGQMLVGLFIFASGALLLVQRRR